jgi:hypothetical protein
MKCGGFGDLSITNKTKQNKLLCFIAMVCQPREICGEICQIFRLKKEGEASAYSVLREFNDVS